MGKEAQGEACGWHYATRRPVQLRWREGKIIAIEEANPPSAEDVWIAPTLFDLQINGYGGVDFQQDELSVEDLLSTARQLRAIPAMSLLGWAGAESAAVLPSKRQTPHARQVSPNSKRKSRLHPQ